MGSRGNLFVNIGLGSDVTRHRRRLPPPQAQGSYKGPNKVKYVVKRVEEAEHGGMYARTRVYGCHVCNRTSRRGRAEGSKWWCV